MRRTLRQPAKAKGRYGARGVETTRSMGGRGVYIRASIIIGRRCLRRDYKDDARETGRTRCACMRVHVCVGECLRWARGEGRPSESS